jgi:hypothetical protein
MPFAVAEQTVALIGDMSALETRQRRGLCLCLLYVQVLGNMKGVIAAAISIALFKNPITAKGMMGYFITVCGVVAYSEVRGGA